MPDTSMISASAGQSLPARVETASILWSRTTTVAPASGPAPVPSIKVPPINTFMFWILFVA
jgi:hypothetical protein